VAGFVAEEVRGVAADLAVAADLEVLEAARSEEAAQAGVGKARLPKVR